MLQVKHSHLLWLGDGVIDAIYTPHTANPLQPLELERFPNTQPKKNMDGSLCLITRCAYVLSTQTLIIAPKHKLKPISNYSIVFPVIMLDGTAVQSQSSLQ